MERDWIGTWVGGDGGLIGGGQTYEFKKIVLTPSSIKGCTECRSLFCDVRMERGWLGRWG